MTLWWWAPGPFRSGLRSTVSPGLRRSDLGDGVHLLHSMGDTFAVMETLEQSSPTSALIVGAGYIGLEMAEAFVARGLSVTQVEQLPEVLPTVDPELGRLVHAQLLEHGVDVLCRTAVTRIGRAPAHAGGRLQVDGVGPDGALTRFADIVLVVVGVRPDTSLAVEAGAAIGAKGAIAVDRHMRTNLTDVFAAGDCVDDLPPSAGRDLSATRHHGPQAGSSGRRERPRRDSGVRREPRDPGGQDL